MAERQPAGRDKERCPLVQPGAWLSAVRTSCCPEANLHAGADHALIPQRPPHEGAEHGGGDDEAQRGEDKGVDVLLALLEHHERRGAREAHLARVEEERVGAVSTQCGGTGLCSTAAAALRPVYSARQTWSFLVAGAQRLEGSNAERKEGSLLAAERQQKRRRQASALVRAPGSAG